MKIVVLGLGNSTLTDDSVGLWIVRKVSAHIGAQGDLQGCSVEISENEAGGWTVLDQFEGAEHAILVDAVGHLDLPPGETAWIPRELFTSARTSGVHNADIFTTVEWGRRHGMKLPEGIDVLGVGVQDTATYGEFCTPAVEGCIEPAARKVLERLRILCQE